MEINADNLEKHREQWASIDGFRNYEVSWWGRVRNIDTSRILNPGTSTGGHAKVALSKNGKKKSHRIHQLVARESGCSTQKTRGVSTT